MEQPQSTASSIDRTCHRWLWACGGGGAAVRRRTFEPFEVRRGRDRERGSRRAAWARRRTRKRLDGGGSGGGNSGADMGRWRRRTGGCGRRHRGGGRDVTRCNAERGRRKRPQGNRRGS